MSSPNFNNNIRYSNNFIKSNYNNYSENNHQTQKEIQGLLNSLKNNHKNSKIVPYKCETNILNYTPISISPYNIISYNDKINNVFWRYVYLRRKNKKWINSRKNSTSRKIYWYFSSFKNGKRRLRNIALISKNLENLGIETAIVKNSNPYEQNKNLNNFQFLINGMIHKKKYDLHYKFGEKRNKELLKNKNEYTKFKEKIKIKNKQRF